MEIKRENAKATVYIVDDIPGNVEMIKKFLVRENYYIIGNTNAVIVEDDIIKYKPDVILLDIMMPSIDGFELCRRIKRNPQSTDIPIIFVTVRSDIEDLVKAYDLGASDYIKKPYDMIELKARIKNQLKFKRTLDFSKKMKNFVENTQQSIGKLREIASDLEDIDSQSAKAISDRLKAELEKLNWPKH